MKKTKRLSASEWLLKQSKRHKRRNFLYTFIVLVITVVLLIFAIRAVKVEPVETMPHSGNSIRNTYLGNITLNNDIRKVNLNDVFKSLRQPLQQSDFSTTSLYVNQFSKNPKENLNKNIENIMFLKKQNIKSINLINSTIDNVQAQDLSKKVEAQTAVSYTHL